MKTDKQQESVKNLQKKVKDLETRINKIFSGKVVLDVKQVGKGKSISVAPRSKMRVACE